MKNSFGLLLFALLLFSCVQNYTPKPHAYYRIAFPEREYRLYDSICPLAFEYPAYGKITQITEPTYDSCWLNISFPKYRGTIHLTYRKIDNNFDLLVYDVWNNVYSKIAQRADAVDDYHIVREPDVYSMIFEIKGNAASPMLFFVTDSTKNFLRGSLYFSVKPNHDSLAPVVNFFREDIIHLIESVKWK